MSSFDPDTLPELVPGDLVMAVVAMRSWEREFYQGFVGEMIMAGEQALVLETWSVGNRRRIRIVRDQRILMFSCAEHNVSRTWKIIVPASRHPIGSCGGDP